MPTQDRSVGLAELAARAQTGKVGKRAANNCRNPECNNGMTPGLVAVGGGTKAQPLFGPGGVGAGKLMRWAWVQCLACNPPEGARRAGAAYRNLNLSEAEIAQRAQLANSRAAYRPEARETLSRTPAAGIPVRPQSSVDAKQLAEMIEQNKQLSARLDEMLNNNAKMSESISRMSAQITALLEDNAKLREQAAKPAVTS